MTSYRKVRSVVVLGVIALGVSGCKAGASGSSSAPAAAAAKPASQSATASPSASSVKGAVGHKNFTAFSRNEVTRAQQNPSSLAAIAQAVGDANSSLDCYANTPASLSLSESIQLCDGASSRAPADCFLNRGELQNADAIELCRLADSRNSQGPLQCYSGTGDLHLAPSIELCKTAIDSSPLTCYANTPASLDEAQSARLCSGAQQGDGPTSCFSNRGQLATEDAITLCSVENRKQIIVNAPSVRSIATIVKYGVWEKTSGGDGREYMSVWSQGIGFARKYSSSSDTVGVNDTAFVVRCDNPNSGGQFLPVDVKITYDSKFQMNTSIPTASYSRTCLFRAYSISNPNDTTIETYVPMPAYKQGCGI